MGPAIWGLVFGLAALYSKGIAVPTGIHYAANLTSSALGAADDTVSIWTVSQPAAPVSGLGGVNWTAILPSVALLVFAIICSELYRRRIARANRILFGIHER
jgi:uncharacterized protein